MGLWDEFERHGSAVKSLDILSQSAVSGSLALPLAGLQGARELSFLTHHPVWHSTTFSSTLLQSLEWSR